MTYTVHYTLYLILLIALAVVIYLMHDQRSAEPIDDEPEPERDWQWPPLPDGHTRHDDAADIFQGVATGFGTPAQRRKWAQTRQTAIDQEDYANSINSCSDCDTTNPTRFARYNHETHCDDCLENYIAGYPIKRAVIVDDLYQWPVFTDKSEGVCANCGDELRHKEMGGSICTRCSELAERWYTIPLEQPLHHQLPRNGNPHMVYIEQTRYGIFDELAGTTTHKLTIEDFLKEGGFDAFDTYDDVWIKWVPPIQGPRQATQTPSPEYHLQPVVLDGDDIPF